MTYRAHYVDLNAPPHLRAAVALPTMTGDRSIQLARLSPDGRSMIGFPFSPSSGTVESPTLHVFDTTTFAYREVAVLTGAWIDWELRWFPDSRRVLLHQMDGGLFILDTARGTWLESGRVEKGTRLSLSAVGESVYQVRSEWETDVWMIERGESN